MARGDKALLLGANGSDLWMSGVGRGIMALLLPTPRRVLPTPVGDNTSELQRSDSDTRVRVFLFTCLIIG